MTIAIKPREVEAGRDLSMVNPFSTRFTRPGAVPPLDSGGQPLDVGAMLDRVTSGCSVIEGLHGRGKTTLLRGLLAAAAAAGRPTALIPVRSWIDAWHALIALAQARAGDVVAIDGWEQLPLPCRPLVVGMARWRQVAVITTAHQPAGLPLLTRCESSPTLAHAILARLPDHGGTISATDVADAYRRHGGNIRDTLGTLYDRFEERRSC